MHLLLLNLNSDQREFISKALIPFGISTSEISLIELFQLPNSLVLKQACGILAKYNEAEAEEYVKNLQNSRLLLPVLLLLPDRLQSKKHSNLLAYGAAAVLYEQDFESKQTPEIIQTSCYWAARNRRITESESFAAVSRAMHHMAHEIRNPLTNIEISVSELRSEIDKESVSESRFLYFIEKNSKRINELLVHTLDFLRTDDLEFERLSLNLVFEDLKLAIEEYLANNKVNLRIQLESELYILADRERVVNALIHLTKFASRTISGQRNPIEIKVFSYQNKAHIKITDTYEENSTNLLQNLFSPYGNFNERISDLSLPAAADIIHKHSGSIKMINVGTGQRIMYVEFPLD